MNYIIIIILTLLHTNEVCSQNDTLPGLTPSFSAIIVSDMDVSISWYQDKLGFSVVSLNDASKSIFEQANLKKGEAHVELIEIQSAQSPKDAMIEYTSKTRLIGLFKIGYSVSDFDKWIEHFTRENVQFNGNIVEDQATKKRMVIILDPDGNRIQIFEK